MRQQLPKIISVFSQIPYRIWSCSSSSYSLDFSSSFSSFSFFSRWYFFRARCRFTSFSSTNFSNFSALSFVCGRDTIPCLINAFQGSAYVGFKMFLAIDILKSDALSIICDLQSLTSCDIRTVIRWTYWWIPIRCIKIWKNLNFLGTLINPTYFFLFFQKCCPSLFQSLHAIFELETFLI